MCETQNYKKQNLVQPDVKISRRKNQNPPEMTVLLCILIGLYYLSLLFSYEP